MKIPSIRKTTVPSPTISDLIEAIEVMSGRRGSRTVNYGTVGGKATLELDIPSLTYAISGLTDSIKYLNQYDDFHDAINKIGSTETVLVITGDAFVESNETIPTTLHPLMLGLGRIYVSSGVTLTWNGTPAVPLPQRQIFYGAGSVSFGFRLTAYPEWFGAVGDANTTTRAGTDDTTALQCAITSLSSGGTIKITKWHGIVGTAEATFTQGLYTTNNNIIVEGCGQKISGFVLIGTALPGFIFRDNNEAQCVGWTWKDLGFYGTADFSLRHASSATSSAIRLYYYDNIKIHDCRFYDFSIGAFYGGLGENVSTNVWFERNYVEVIDTANTPYLGFGVVHAKGVWVRDNTFDNCALAVSMETVSTGSGLYNISSFHINNNTIKNVMDSGSDATDTGMGIQIQATSNYVFDGEISGNVIEDVQEQVAASSGSPSGIGVLGDSSEIGASAHVYNVVVSNNVIGTVTSDATSPTVYGLYFGYCKDLSVIGNTIKGVSGSGGYGIRVYETASSLFLGNLVRGSNWLGAINEYATIECNNTFIGNQSTDMPSVFSSLTTSKSFVLQNQPSSSLASLNLDVLSGRISEDGDIIWGTSNANYLTTFKHVGRNIDVAEATGTPSGTTTYFDIAVAVPSGARLLGCQLRVDTALTTGETWSAAFNGGSSTAIVTTGQAVAKNTKVNKMIVDEITTNTTNIRITRDAGNFTDGVGVISAFVHYESLAVLPSA